MISILALIGIIYGAIMCIMQTDPEKADRLFIGQPPGVCDARHLAFNMQGLEGGIYQMLNHGVSTGGCSSSSA